MLLLQEMSAPPASSSVRTVSLESLSRSYTDESDSLSNVRTPSIDQLVTASAAAVVAFNTRREHLAEAGPRASRMRFARGELNLPLHGLKILLGEQPAWFSAYMREYLLRAAVSVAASELLTGFQIAVKCALHENCKHSLAEEDIQILQSFLHLPCDLAHFCVLQLWALWLPGAVSATSMQLTLRRAIQRFQALPSPKKHLARQWVCEPAGSPLQMGQLQLTSAAAGAAANATAVWASAPAAGAEWLDSFAWQMCRDSKLLSDQVLVPHACSRAPRTAMVSCQHVEALAHARSFHVTCLSAAKQAALQMKAAIHGDALDFPDVDSILCAPLACILKWQAGVWVPQQRAQKWLSNWAGKSDEVSAPTFSGSSPFAAQHVFSWVEWLKHCSLETAAPGKRIWMGVLAIARALVKLRRTTVAEKLLCTMANWPNKSHWLGARTVYSAVLLRWVLTLRSMRGSKFGLAWQQVAAAATTMSGSQESQQLEEEQLLNDLHQAPQAVLKSVPLPASADFVPIWPACEPERSQLVQLLHMDPFASKNPRLKRARTTVAVQQSGRWASRRNPAKAFSQGSAGAPSPASSKTSFDAAAVPSIKLLVSAWQSARVIAAASSSQQQGAVDTVALLPMLPKCHTGALASFVRLNKVVCEVRTGAAKPATGSEQIGPKVAESTGRYLGLHAEAGCGVEEVALQMLCNVTSPSLLCTSITPAASVVQAAREVQATSFTPAVVDAHKRWTAVGGYPAPCRVKGVPGPLGLLGWRGTHAENGLWRALKAICMSPVLQAAESCLHSTPFPVSWGTQRFAQQYNTHIQSILGRIRPMSPCQAAKWVFELSTQQHGRLLPGMQWDLYSAELLAELVHCLCSGQMGAIPLADWLQHALYDAPGIDVGYPDLVLWRPDPCPAGCKYGNIFSDTHRPAGDSQVQSSASQATVLGSRAGSQDSAVQSTRGSQAALTPFSPERSSKQQSTTNHSMSTPGSSLWGTPVKQDTGCAGSSRVHWGGTRFVAAEVKSASDSMREAQRMWMSWMAQHPGITAGLIHVEIISGTDDRRATKRSRRFKGGSIS